MAWVRREAIVIIKLSDAGDRVLVVQTSGSSCPPS